jgi:hypothetical protein
VLDHLRFRVNAKFRSVQTQNYPQRTLNISGRPADAYMELQKSFGSLNLSSYNGCMSKNGYYTNSTGYGLMQSYTQGAITTASGFGILATPNQFYLGVDTEVVARKTNLLSGINVNSSPMFFRAQIGQILSAYQHTLYFFGFYDLILEIDVVAKNIIAKF